MKQHKYIKKIKKNGKWRYYYENKSGKDSSDITTEVLSGKDIIRKLLYKLGIETGINKKERVETYFRDSKRNPILEKNTGKPRVIYGTSHRVGDKGKTVTYQKKVNEWKKDLPEGGFVAQYKGSGFRTRIKRYD